MDRDKKIDDEVHKLARAFNSNISELIRILTAKFPTNSDVLKLQNIINLVKSYEPDLIFERCIPKIWESRKAIETRNEKYFIDKKYDGYIKKDENQQFMRNLVALIVTNLPDLKEAEKKIIWDIINKLLKLTAKCMIVRGDYKGT